MWWLLLWPLLGLLGWAWTNYSVHRQWGVYDDPMRWVLLVISLVIGPFMAVHNFVMSRMHWGRVYWGLRFK